MGSTKMSEILTLGVLKSEKLQKRRWLKCCGTPCILIKYQNISFLTNKDTQIVETWKFWGYKSFFIKWVIEGFQKNLLWIDPLLTWPKPARRREEWNFLLLGYIFYWYSIRIRPLGAQNIVVPITPISQISICPYMCFEPFSFGEGFNNMLRYTIISKLD